MKHFDSLGLPQPLMRALAQMQFTTPTPIQAQAIPPALEGKDILGSAQTGTGKTAAFGIPLVAALLQNPNGAALIMTPTRELATQVLDTLHSLLGKKSPINTALLIGGESMPKQLRQLQKKPRIIVGTPGRINDHLNRRSLKLGNVNFLVLDETDRMLDMGFAPQIDKICAFLPEKRQTLLFSATLPKNIMRVAEKYLHAPVRISVGATTQPAANIKQDVQHMAVDEKYPSLLVQLGQRNGSVLIFVKTKHGADKMAKRLRAEHHTADAIHGNLSQNKRNRVISAFRNKKNRILVATDVAARGLDIPHIEHVINFDLPQCAEDYIHRIGRTARAGAEGEALCFVSPEDKAKWGAITRLLNPDAKVERAPRPNKKRPKNKKPYRSKKRQPWHGKDNRKQAA
ncbi:MAG: DEAD/DEAH box helicase [Rickettsiales bacterium]